MKKSLAAALCLLIATPVYAETVTLEGLLETVRQQRDELGQAQSHDDEADTRLLADARAQFVAATAKNDQLMEQFDAGKLELAQMWDNMHAESSEANELFAVVRDYSGAAAGSMKGSLVSAQFGADRELLIELSDSGNIPSPEQLHEFHVLMLNEMIESGKVARFSAESVNAAGIPAQTEIVRIGMFNLIAGDKYLRYEVNSRTIQELARQPARRYRSNAKNLFDATGGVADVAIDPTAGQLLSQLIQAPSVRERVKQGGPVGYVIIALGLLGLLIGLYRLLYLAGAGVRIKSQLKSDTVKSNSALGRILGVYQQYANVNTETLELKIDEAIIRETPALERWQMALKVIAAVAPLLGLLGTVIGMIETFHQITLSGTSEPRLMADGISKALVTTMLGLLVAVPMVLIHSLVASRSKNLIEILEEQSAAIIANQAEKNL